MDAPTLKRWESKVRRTRTCWLWTDVPDAYGYGKIIVKGKWYRAARLGYEHFVGPIPEGLELDHTCRVRLCVRPSHLEPVPGKVNILRGNGPAAINARKTHCIRGHEFTPENTAMVNTGRGRVGRRCLTCYPRRKSS
jgi:hypothetical protein